MNFYKFINSQSISRHLEKNNYRFGTAEAAFVVYQSKFASLKQKFDAWEQIIATMPNVSVSRHNCYWEGDVSDFHQFLRDYMGVANAAITEFADPTDAVYFYSVLYQGSDAWNVREKETPYKTAQKCVEKIQLDKDTPVKAYKITKRKLDNADYEVTLTYIGQGEIMNFFATEAAIGTQKSDLACYFEGLWFAIPTPFKAGDVVCYVKGDAYN